MFCVDESIISGQSTLLENRRQAEADCNYKSFQLFPNVCSDEVIPLQGDALGFGPCFKDFSVLKLNN